MNPYLVGAPGMDFDLQQRELSKLLNHSIFANCAAAAFALGGHAGSNRRMTRNRHLDGCLSSCKFSMYQGEVGLFNLSLLEHFSQHGVRSIIFRDDQQPRGLLVDAVNNTGASITQIRQILLEVVKQSMDKSTVVYAGSGMDHEARRLFNDRQVRVFVVDLERNLLGSKRRRFERFEDDMDGFTAANPVAGFFTSSFDRHRSRSVQLLDLRSRDAAEMLSKELVEPRAFVLSLSEELHCG